MPPTRRIHRATFSAWDTSDCANEDTSLFLTVHFATLMYSKYAVFGTEDPFVRTTSRLWGKWIYKKKEKKKGNS